jgi:hypothetical protein
MNEDVKGWKEKEKSAGLQARYFKRDAKEGMRAA